MKICSHCQTTYTDDSMQFCLQDGSPLQTIDRTSASSNDWSDSPTLMSPRSPDKIRVDLRNTNAPPNSSADVFVGEPTYAEPPEKKTNAKTLVALTALVTLLAAGAGAIGVFYYMRGGQTETVQNNNVKIINAATATPTPTAKPTANVNSANANASPTATPTPKPTLRPEQISDVEDGVADSIENWRRSSDDIDIDAHLGNYADTVDYYKAGRVGIARVRADKERAFGTYRTINIAVSNIKVKPDDTGEKATAVFDKEWIFEGDETNSSGKVLQQLQFAKIGGKWRITGEKDLKTYYYSK